MKHFFYKSFVLALGLTALWGCSALDELEQKIHANSKDAVVEDATAHNKSQAKNQGKAKNTQKSKEALEQKQSESLAGNTIKGTHATLIDKTQDPNTQLSDADKKALADEQAALANTATDDDSIGTGNLPPVDESTAAEISNMPEYATASGRQTCPTRYGERAKTIAYELSSNLIAKLSSDHGNIYVAPTVIPDEYQDCVSDVSSEIKNAVQKSGNFTPVSDANVESVAQNAGSSTIIPRTVRECRQRDIPYLAVSVIKKTGGNPVLSVRIIRVNTGVTLTQSYKKLN